MSFDCEANLKDTNSIILDLSPGGLSLPSRDYYLEENFTKQREYYENHLNELSTLLAGENIDLVDDFATRVIRFEKKLAMISMKKVISLSA